MNCPKISKPQNPKTPKDLDQFDRLLKKVSVKAVLNAEITHHLEYDKNQPRTSSNARNGYSTKTVASSGGSLELRTPRDRDGTFEPQMVKKNQTRITGMDKNGSAVDQLRRTHVQVES